MDNLATNFYYELRRGSGLRVLKLKFQSVVKRNTPSWSVLTVLVSNAFALLFVWISFDRIVKYCQSAFPYAKEL